MATQRERVERALSLLPFLSKRSRGGTIPVPVEMVKRTFGYSDRELLHDIESLMMCGPNEWDQITLDVNERGVHVMAPKITNPFPLTVEEGVVLALASQPFATATGTRFGKVVKQARAKVMKGLARHHQRAAKDLGQRIKVNARRPPTAWTAVIQKGLEKQRKIKLEYFAVNTGSLKSYTVSPILLKVVGDRWYLHAFSDVKGEALRMFRLDRIKRAVLLKDVARKALPHDLEIITQRGTYLPSGNMMPATIEYSSKIAKEIREHYGDRAKPVRGGAVRVELVSNAPVWVVSQILQWAGEAKVVDSEVVKLAVRETCDQALARYGCGK